MYRRAEPCRDRGRDRRGRGHVRVVAGAGDRDHGAAGRPRPQRILIAIERFDRSAIARLVDGDLDLVLGAESMTMPPGQRRRVLHREPFAVIARPDHPRLTGRLTLERYVALDHLPIAVEGRGPGVVDRQLARRGLARRVAVRVPHFASAGLAVRHSDLVCTVARTVAHRARELSGVRVHDAPLALPSPALIAWWPRRHDADPARRWFRAAVTARPRTRSLAGQGDEDR